MSTFEYRVVALAPPIAKGKGLSKAVSTFEAQINDEARQGWEFLRIESVPTQTKRLLRGKRTDHVEYLLFIRHRGESTDRDQEEAATDFGRFLGEKDEPAKDAPQAQADKHDVPDYGRFLRGKDDGAPISRDSNDELTELERKLDELENKPLSPARPVRTEALPPLVLKNTETDVDLEDADKEHTRPRIENAVRGARGWFSWDKDDEGPSRADNKPALRAIR